MVFSLDDMGTFLIAGTFKKSSSSIQVISVGKIGSSCSAIHLSSDSMSSTNIGSTLALLLMLLSLNPVLYFTYTRAFNLLYSSLFLFFV
ncbi:hypothetical protein LguiB_020046 [Lonicera macranthoides]